MWLVDKYIITFKLVVNARRISRSPVQMMPGPGTERLINTALNHANSEPPPLYNTFASHLVVRNTPQFAQQLLSRKSGLRHK